MTNLPFTLYVVQDLIFFAMSSGSTNDSYIMFEVPRACEKWSWYLPLIHGLIDFCSTMMIH